MHRTIKLLSMVFCLIFAAFSPFVINSTGAQVGVTVPSSPGFGVSYTIIPTEIPPVYGVDPSSGKAVITKEGYTVYDEIVIVGIVNQPFINYKDSNGNSIQLFYNIRWKEPSNNSWVEPVTTTQSQNEERTITTFGFKDNYHDSGPLDIPLGAEVDFQVEASIGYYTPDNAFVGNSSGWTNPQTVQHAQNLTATPTPPNVRVGVFGLGWLVVGVAVLAVVAVVLLAAVAVLLRKRARRLS